MEECDPFGPPAECVEVECLHCGRRYRSDDLVERDGLWCCPTVHCGGAGFGFDVQPVTHQVSL
jgi:hypothetical protein